MGIVTCLLHPLSSRTLRRSKKEREKKKEMETENEHEFSLRKFFFFFLLIYNRRQRAFELGDVGKGGQGGRRKEGLGARVGKGQRRG